MALVFYDSGDGRRITRGEEVFQCRSVQFGPAPPPPPLSEIPSEEIETGHPGETVAIRSEIAKCPLNVRQIEIPGTPAEAAVQ